MQDKRGSSAPMDADQHLDPKNRPAEVDAWLTEKLREAYGEVAVEPIPTSLLNLLKQLDKNEGSGS